MMATGDSALHEEADRAARGLMAHGVRSGDRVGVWAPGRSEATVAQVAAERIGATCVTIDPACDPRQLRDALERDAVSMLVMTSASREADFVELLVSVWADCPLLREALVVDERWGDLLEDGAMIDDAQLAERCGAAHPGG